MEYQTTLSANEPIAITIGNFDGIHKGHLHLMYELRELAKRLNCVPVLVTFSPHTLMVVRPDINVQYLTTLEEKLALAKHYGQVADSIVISFTPQVVAMTAQQFMDTLCSRFTIKGMVVGADFSLGHKRMGDVAFLRHYGQEHGIQLQTISLEEADNHRISSTRIRTLVSEGNVAEANELLGHPVIASGPVKHGNERGRLLGFPTANIFPEAQKLLPANGVYAIRTRIYDGLANNSYNGTTAIYNGVSNIGVRPTFNENERLLEVHLFDVTLDLYDKHLLVEFIAHLRSEQRFASVDALKAQIAIDVQQARQILNQ